MKSQLSSYNNLLYSIESLLLVVYTHSKARPTVEGMSQVFLIIRTVYVEHNNSFLRSQNNYYYISVS